jgi:ribose-phosphate pyrophosphokinase
LNDLVIVSPDAGGMERARAFAKHLNATVAMIDKRRIAPNVAKAMNMVGDVNGKVALILDDMIDTAGTLCEAASAVMDHGASEVFAVATHGVLSGPAYDRIEQSPLKSVIVTDTIPLLDASKKSTKVKQISVAGILAEAIYRIHHYDSVSNLFI